MGEQAIPEFGLKPGAFWRHYITAVCNSKKLFYRNRKQTKCHFHITAVYSFLQFFESPDAANEIYSFIGTLIFNTEKFFQDITRQYGYIQYANRVIRKGAFPGSKNIPLPFQLHAKFMQL